MSYKYTVRALIRETEEQEHPIDRPVSLHHTISEAAAIMEAVKNQWRATDVYIQDNETGRRVEVA